MTPIPKLSFPKSFIGNPGILIAYVRMGSKKIRLRMGGMVRVTKKERLLPMNRHDVDSRQKIREYPCLTITLPTHRSSPENRQDPIRVKNLVKEATERLLEDHNSREIAPLLTRLDKLAENIDYRDTLDGLAP